MGLRVNGKAIKHILVDKDIKNIAKIAESIGMSAATWRYVMDGEKNTTLDTVAKIAEAIGENPIDLLVYEPDEQKEIA